MKAERNRQYNEHIRENVLPKGTLSSVKWNKTCATWIVNLRQLYFTDQAVVGTFKQLSDATAAMEELDESLKHLLTLMPSGSKSKIEVVQEGETKQIVDKAIQKVQDNHNASTKSSSKSGEWRRSEIEDII